MGFIDPAPPPVDMEEWKRKPHLERIKPLAQDWAINGFGTPSAVYLLYIAKLAVFAVGAALVISTTEGLGGLGNFTDWWTEPIVWQKLVVWMILWEFLGIGSSSMPLSFRFLPPIGGPLFWLRPGAVRLPPWPDRVPFTGGSRRTVFDVVLALGVYAGAGYLLIANARRPTAPWRGVSTRPRSPCCSGFWSSSACATRSHTSQPVPRSTACC